MSLELQEVVHDAATKFKLQASKLAEELSVREEKVVEFLESTSRSAEKTYSILLKGNDLDSAKEEEASEKHVVDLSVEAMRADMINKIDKHQCNFQAHFTELTKKELEEACATSLKTLGVIKFQYEVGPDQYLKKVFQNISTELYSQFEESGQKWACQTIECFLNCQVTSAEDLKARDDNGFSDPYCILGIVHKDIAAQEKSRPHLQEWKKEGIVKELFVTQIQQKTLNPTWNETFEMKSVCSDEYVLVVEVWDADVDDDKTEATGIKGKLDSLFHEAKEMFHKPFIGYATHPVQVRDKDITLDLNYHSSKHHHGRIKLRLDLHAHYLKKVPDGSSLRDHHRLASALVTFESTENSEHLKQWDGQLSEEATQLLSMHSTIFYLTKLQQTAVLLAVILDYHRAFRVQVSCFQKLVATVSEDEEGFAQYTKTEHGAELLNNLKEVWSNIVESMNHHSLNLYSDGLREVEENLLTLRDLHKIWSFVSLRLNADNGNFKNIVSSCIEASTSYLLILRTEKIATIKNEADQCRAVVTLFDTYISECEDVKKLFQPLFHQVDPEIDYFSVYSQIVGTNLVAIVQRGLPSAENCMLVYQLYQKVQTLISMCSVSCTQQLVNDVYKNFGLFVPFWIDVALAKAHGEIETFIKMDQVKEVSESVTFSSSAVDFTFVINKLVTFWCNLDLAWPDKAKSVHHTVTIVKGIGELASSYVKEFIKEKVHEKNLTDGNGRFHLSHEFCISLTNLKHMRHVVKKLPQRMQLDKFLQGVRENETSKQREQTERLINDALEGADKSLMGILEVQMEKLLTNLFQEVKSFIILILSDSAKEKPTIDQMLDYLQTNMSVFVRAHLTNVFMSILQCLWVHIAETLKEKKAEMASLSNSEKHLLSQTLWTMTDAMRNFFHAGGDGLTEEQLNTDDFRILVDELELTKLHTDELIARVLSTIVQQQSLPPAKHLGTLHFSHRYIEDEGMLEVDLSYAEKLCGKIDAFVELVLVPEDNFPDIKPATKSAVKHNADSPVFNETFQLPASKSAMNGNSVLLLAVYDHHLLRNHKFVGMCAVNCNSVPSGYERRVEHLPLFEYSNHSYTELGYRDEEAAADLYFTLHKIWHGTRLASGCYAFFPTCH